jgi:hypothetical protein
MKGIGLILMAAAVAAQAPLTPPPATGTGLIVGQVVDAASGGPIAGAVVSVNLPASFPTQVAVGLAQPSRTQAMTGTDGRFAFRDLPKGTFTITSTKGGYLDGGYGRRRPGGPTQSIELEEGQRTGVVAVPMWKHAVLSGRILDEAGEPVIGLQVRTLRRTIVGGLRRFAQGPSGSTDDRGIYRIPMLVPGDYIVALVSTQVTVPAALMEEYDRLMQTNDPARTAIMDALVQSGTFGLGRGGSPDSVQVGGLIQTVGRGAVPPPPVPEGRMFAYPTTFYPAAMSSAQAVVVSVKSGEERTGIDVQLKPVAMSRVSGVVMGPDGPAGAISVRLVPADAEPLATDLETATAVTDRTGAFTLLGVPPGQYMLRVTKTPRNPLSAAGRTTTIVETGTGGMMMTMSAPTGEASLPPPIPTDPTLWAAVPIAVGRADVTGVTVPLRTGLRVSGRVEFDGTLEKPAATPLQRIAVTIDPIEGRTGTGAPFIPPGRVDASGQFNTYGLPGGRYFVRVPGAPAGWTFKSAIHQGRDVSDVALDLDSGDVSGVVITFTDQPTELSGSAQTVKGPDPDATVIVFPSDNTAWLSTGLNPRRIRSSRTSQSGAYKITGLPPGSYYVAAIPDELASDWQDPRFLEALARSAAQVTLDDGQKKTQHVRTTQVR